MTTKTSTPKLGDFLKSEWDYRYCRREGTYTNGTGSDVTLNLGQPFSINESTGVLTAIDDGSESSAECFLVSNIDQVIADGESVDLAVLIRGPAIVNGDALPETAIDGGTFDNDALVTVLEGLSPPVVVLTEPSVSSTSEQTT